MLGDPVRMHGSITSILLKKKKFSRSNYPDPNICISGPNPIPSQYSLTTTQPGRKTSQIFLNREK